MRCLNVAPCVWPWSERTTISYGRGAYAARPLDPAELLVELAQRLERVRALEARVVRDLVVARERRVDRGPPLHHVREHAVDDQVADEDAERRAHQRVVAAAVTARPHVAALRAGGGGQLEDDLPEEEDERRVTLKPFARNAR